MVKFNELFTLPCNGGIYIDCSVLDMPYFDKVFIDKIIIDTQDSFNKAGISENPIYSKTIDGDLKSIKLAIRKEEFLIPLDSNTIYFVYIITKGIPAVDTPCGMDSKVTLGAVVDTYSIYKRALKYLSSLNMECNIPRYFIDFILRYKAFKLALKTRDFPLAIKYWKMFNGTNTNNYRLGCGCNR